MGFQSNVNTLLGTAAATKSNLFTKQQMPMPQAPVPPQPTAPMPVSKQKGQMSKKRAKEIAKQKQRQHKDMINYVRVNKSPRTKKGGSK